MSKINVSTETLRGVNEEIEAITEALIQNKTELKSLMEQINNKIASDEVKPRLVAYGEILEEVCKNTNQTLASLKEYLGNQIEKYERIDAETREKLASEARILEQLNDQGVAATTAAGAAAVAGGAALAGGGNEDTTAQAQTTGDTSIDTNGEGAQANNSSDSTDSGSVTDGEILATGAAASFVAAGTAVEGVDFVQISGPDANLNYYQTPDGVIFSAPKNLDPSLQGISVAQAVESYNSLPPELKQYVKTVDLVDYYNPADPEWREKYKNFTKSFATGGNGNVTFYRNDGPVSDTKLQNTFAHEAAHTMDQRVAKGLSNYSSSNEWKSAVAADKVISGKIAPTKYGENDLVEDFADSVKLYVSDNANFKAEYPNRYELISNLFNEGQSSSSSQSSSSTTSDRSQYYFDLGQEFREKIQDKLTDWLS